MISEPDRHKILAKYSDDQVRDANGRWTAGGDMSDEGPGAVTDKNGDKQGANWNAKPINVKAPSEASLPEQHNHHDDLRHDISYWTGYGKERGAYRCETCGQRYKLTGPKAKPFTSYYD